MWKIPATTFFVVTCYDLVLYYLFYLGLIEMTFLWFKLGYLLIFSIIFNF